MRRRSSIALLVLGSLTLGAIPLGGCSRRADARRTTAPVTSEIPMAARDENLPPVPKSDAEWRAKLTPAQYHVLREKGTERPGTGKYWKTTDAGEYRCAGCGAALFMSDSKFDSHCGWPSFDKATANIVETVDSDGSRTEITCKRCGGHVGHVFDDGPTATGLRYCVNSASVDLKPKAADTKPAADSK